jgi:CheY-like chemotaxis protein
MDHVMGMQETQAQNILIVDDDPDTCTLLDTLFRARGYSTMVVYNGQDAVQYVEAGEPDAVVLDVMMPDMDGWETFRQMRLRSNVPVLFLTALASGDNAARALSLGVNDYVRKPFQPSELYARLELLFANHRQPVFTNRSLSMRLERPTVSVVIPTLNEDENLPFVLPYLPMEWIDEVVLVDGRSTDRTIQVALELMPSISVVLEPRLGKGAALRAGYQSSSGDIIIVMDADGSNDPREIPRFVTALMEGSDFVKGSRFARGGGTTDMPRLRYFGNKFFVSLVNLFFNVHFSDLCYGYHAFWRYCLDDLYLEDVDGFEIDTAVYIRALCQHMRVTEVPSFEGYRFRGIGKLRTFPDGLRVLKTILGETIRNLRSPNRSFYPGFRGQQPEGISSLDTPVVKTNLFHD